MAGGKAIALLFLLQSRAWARALKPTSLDGTLDETSHVPRAYGTLGTAICNYSPYHWYPAFYTDAMEAVAGLHKDTGPTVSIGHGPYMKCKAIVCHQDVKISICNDNSRDILLSREDIADAAAKAIEDCKGPERILSQLFSSDHWNVVVRKWDDGGSCLLNIG